MRGRAIPLSANQRAAADLLRFSIGVPTVTSIRHMNLRAVVEARASSAARPRWIAIFIKACAMAAQDYPHLRRVYLPYPWPHYYEYPASSAMLLVSREHSGEALQFGLIIKDPASLALAEIDRRISEAIERPAHEVRPFRQAVAFVRLPWFFRRFLLWLAYNIGRLRPNLFGTFGVTAPRPENAPPRMSIWTTRLNYGRVTGDGAVAVDVTVDHRVVDGETGALALARMEELLNGPIAGELRG